ncbi:16S rRNA (cytidine(1402)-2'-O)-methyltransferase [candidate division WWE3 bacterium CG_4_9_14_3_um_filter_41_6]|uniref:Ribosomal RNA small subunit methyltransferase I n=1 Tax=candidate division WWE3 bacterium CG_4_10_14_0_2_um_filter_41_14 TaxID=1975072 RepID=A0A2M7TL20_UNCKA|nr:MAG: 16S rRNA (cytidine(1402)-2'-O)-methyltransferase [candidate division WWE3 bacterium CG_4_10_14_0_2_um_filter_41_14]PJA39529.1 MAG: 16S rRNA (cytidine(1402)-2'-O)-methyltransferase [candidate division WWE3 bacterium CG_4_9_14_3_um_filter_41_6]
MGKLILIPTPIGNVGDMTFRAVESLFSCDILLCEDTRDGQRLFEAYRDKVSSVLKDNQPLLLSYNDHNRDERIPQVLAFLSQDKTVGLVTDRGTPLLSDPGYKLMQAVIAQQKTSSDISITTLPGATALIPALQLSGFPPTTFYFAGFISKKTKARQTVLSEFPKTTIVLYESPHRLLSLFADIKLVLGEIPVSVSREITKVYEETIRGTVSECIAHFETKHPKGEFVVVIDNRVFD